MRFDHGRGFLKMAEKTQVQEAKRSPGPAERAALTPLRSTVLNVIAESQGPIKAYALLAAVRKRRPTQAMTIYRALAYLVRAGLIHRIDSMAAFMACRQPGHTSVAIFLVCEWCGGVEEHFGRGSEKISEDAEREAGFRMRDLKVEGRGLCARCRHLSDAGGRDGKSN